MTKTVNDKLGDEHALSSAPQDPVIARLEHFQVIRNRYLKWLVTNLPVLLTLLFLIDWLIGPNIFARDLFRLSAILGVIIELLIFNSLFTKVPEALGIIWTRGLVASGRGASSTQTEFLGFIQEFEVTLNHRRAILIGVVFIIATAISTYPARFWMATGRSPFSLRQFFYLGTGGVYFLEILVAYFVGLLAWRFGVIAVFIDKLGRQFVLKIQPKHPDRSGGLRPLGDLCLTSAFLILVPVIILSIWVVVGSQPGFEVYTLWSDIFRKWLLVLSAVSVFVFFRPLYHIHQQMVKQRREIQHELDEVSRRMEGILLELRTKADSIDPEEATKQLKTVEFLGEIHDEYGRIPTWPFDWNIIIKFAAAEAVPVLSFIGVSQPILKVVSPAIPFLSNP